MRIFLKKYKKSANIYLFLQILAKLWIFYKKSDKMLAKL